MSTHIFSYIFLTRIKYIFLYGSMVACKGVVALDMFSKLQLGIKGASIASCALPTHEFPLMTSHASFLFV
jgi:hypothetical protein